MKPHWTTSTRRLVTVAVSRLVRFFSSLCLARDVVTYAPEEGVEPLAEAESLPSEGLDLPHVGFWHVRTLDKRRLANPEDDIPVVFVLPHPDGGEARVVRDKIPAIGKTGDISEEREQLLRRIFKGA